MPSCTSISCPNCGSDIRVETRMLLLGQSFTCSAPSCRARVNLKNTEHGDIESRLRESARLGSDVIAPIRK